MSGKILPWCAMYARLAADQRFVNYSFKNISIILYSEAPISCEILRTRKN